MRICVRLDVQLCYSGLPGPSWPSLGSGLGWASRDREGRVCVFSAKLEPDIGSRRLHGHCSHAGTRPGGRCESSKLYFPHVQGAELLAQLGKDGGGRPACTLKAPAWSGQSRSKHGQGDPALFSFQTESQRLKEEEREKWG